MEFIKKNFKTIIAFVMGIVLASGACIYAAYKYNSTDVVYQKQNGNEVSVKSALDELYSNLSSETFVKTGTLTNTHRNTKITIPVNFTPSLVILVKKSDSSNTNVLYDSRKSTSSCFLSVSDAQYERPLNNVTTYYTQMGNFEDGCVTFYDIGGGNDWFYTIVK